MITMIKKDGTSTEITPSSANMEGVAAPSTDSNTGANAQELADPAITAEPAETPTSDTDAQNDGAESILESSVGDGGGKNQDAQTNARYAAARRAAEKQRDEAVASARAEADSAARAKIENFIRSMNLRDPDGHLISTEEEYSAYTASRDGRLSTAETAAQTGITPEKVDELVSAHPDVRAAQEAQEQLSQAQDALARERAEKALDEQVTKVREAFPEITSVDDIVKLPRYPDIKTKVAQGYSLADAVKLAYEDVYLKRRSAAAAQQARNAISSTAHLTSTKAHGSGGVNVTEAQIKIYMDAIPGSSRDQAINAYRKYKFGAK